MGEISELDTALLTHPLFPSWMGLSPRRAFEQSSGLSRHHTWESCEEFCFLVTWLPCLCVSLI